MANFFVATAFYADGHSETFEGQLWFLGGLKNEEGHALLNKLKEQEKAGVITRLWISYES